MSVTRRLGALLSAALLGGVTIATPLSARANLPVPTPQVQNSIILYLNVTAPGTPPNLGYDPTTLNGPRVELAYDGPLAALGGPLQVAANQGAVNVQGTVILNPVLGQLKFYCKDDNYTSTDCTASNGGANFSAPAGATTVFVCPYEIVIDPPPPFGAPNYPTDLWQLVDGIQGQDFLVGDGFLQGSAGQSNTVARSAYLTSQPQYDVFASYPVLSANNGAFSTLPLQGSPGNAGTVGDTCPATQPSACPAHQATGLPNPNFGNTPIRFCVDVQFTIPASVIQNPAPATPYSVSVLYSLNY